MGYVVETFITSRESSMDKIFFAIIGLAFGFAILQTFNHQMLSSNAPEFSEADLTPDNSYLIKGSVSTSEDIECLDTPSVYAIGASRFRPISTGTVTAKADMSGWLYELPVPQQKSANVIVFCDAKSRPPVQTALAELSEERQAELEKKGKQVSKKRAEGTFAISQQQAQQQDLIIKPVDEPAAVVGQAALSSAKASVDLAIGLIGYITLFLGLMKIVEKAGGLAFMARLIRPLLVRLFPDVPPDHPAMGAMVMNISANALGLGNAATPFGLKAMKELNSINPHKGTATNAMCLFLAINTSGLALLPTGIIGLRAKFGSADPAAIFPTTLMATALSTVAGICAAKLLSRFFASPKQDEDFIPYESQVSANSGLKDLVPLLLFAASLLGLVLVVYTYKEVASAWIMPGLIFGMVAIGVIRKVPVYQTFVEGAKEGFQLGVMIIPYLVAILSAIGMFRASGGLGFIVDLVAPLTDLILLPGEALPLALLRPLSGSGSFGITAELIQNYGPDGYIGNLVSTMNGSTETTFYVLAVYFGSVGINRYRHALWAGITADIVGVLASIWAVNLLIG